MHDGRFPAELVSGVPVVAAPEEIDITNAPELRSALVQAASDGPGTLVADMTRTRFCDSSGLHALLAAHKRAQAEGGELLLVIPSTAVLRVFAVTGIDRMIPSFTSLDEALAQTPSNGSNGRRRPDDGLEGSAANTTGTAADLHAERRSARTIRHDYDDELPDELAGSEDDEFADPDAGLTAAQAARVAGRVGRRRPVPGCAHRGSRHLQ